MVQLTPQKPSEQAHVDECVHHNLVHLNVHLCYVQRPSGQRRVRALIIDLQYVELYIPPGWRVVKIQWEGMLWIYACQVSPVKNW